MEVSIFNIFEIFKEEELQKEILNFFIGFLFSLTILFINRKILVKVISKFLKKTKNRFDDYLIHSKSLIWLSYLLPLYLLYFFSLKMKNFGTSISLIIQIIFTFFFLLTILSFLTAISSYLEENEKLANKPIKSYFQVIKIIITIWFIIIIFGIITGHSPLTILGGLSAITAIILLLFRDTILSFVASIQISMYDLIKIGDWIESPTFGADGVVIEISLNIVKVQNWDKSITLIPTFKLIENSFKNWRGMVDAGVRRISRSIFIDIESIKFLTEEEIKELEKINLLSDYIKEKKIEIDEWNKNNSKTESNEINKRKLTNISIFIEYIKRFLETKKEVKKDFTFMVRQLESTPNGLPIEIYVFLSEIDWVRFEGIQSDIFDHLLVSVQYFGLKLFQNPSGNNLTKLISEKMK